MCQHTAAVEPETVLIRLLKHKDHVYTTETKTSDELKARITDVCSTIPPCIIKKAAEDVIKWAQYFVAAEGDLFEHAL